MCKSMQIQCQKCKCVKNENDFWNTKYRSNGKQAWCKECMKAHQREHRSYDSERRKQYRAENADKYREYARRYAAKQRAKNKANGESKLAEFKAWLQSRKEASV